MMGVWMIGIWEFIKDFEFGVMLIFKFYDQEVIWGDFYMIILFLIQDEDEVKCKVVMIFVDWVVDNGQVWVKVGYIFFKLFVLEKQEFKDMFYCSDYFEVVSVVKFSKKLIKIV